MDGKMNGSDDAVRLALEKLANSVLYVEKKNGEHFLSKLIAIKDDTLVFETKDGAIRINSLSEIASARAVPIYKGGLNDSA